jgi:HD-like signal output (HDOD) protein
VFHQVYHDYMEDKLQVPTLPDLANKVRKAVSNPELTPDELAKVIQVDPSAVAHVIRVANSPLYRGTSPIDNIRDAIVRLGYTVTRDQVTGFILRNVFDSSHAAVREQMRRLWKSSALVGALAFVLARLTRGANPEQALLGGLLQDIGAAVVLRQADAHPEFLGRRLELDATVTELRGQVGAMVIRKWGLPAEFVTVALESENWTRDAGPHLDLCDVVLLAQFHAHVGTPRMKTLPQPKTLPMFGKLPRGELSPQLSLEVLEEAKEDVSEVHRTLLA